MDPGIEVVGYVFNRMQIDKEWCVTEPRGFTWWSGPFFKQHVWAEEPFEANGYPICRVHARTNVWENLDIDSKTFQRLIIPYTGHAIMSGYVRDPEDSMRFQLASSIYVHAGTLEWLKQVFSIVVPMQAIEPNRFNFEQYIQAKEEGGIEAEFSAEPHPISGWRKDIDNMLTLTDEVMAFIYPLK